LDKFSDMNDTISPATIRFTGQTLNRTELIDVLAMRPAAVIIDACALDVKVQ